MRNSSCASTYGDGVPRPASIACDERTGLSSGAKNASSAR